MADRRRDAVRTAGPTDSPPPPTRGPTRRPVLTAVAGAVTIAVSVAAFTSPALMALLTRDLSRLRAGQWWRAFTPALVQSAGWGQLGFNLLRPAVIGAALEGRVSRPCWSLVYLLGGVGSLAVLSVRNPDAVAALLGAFSVLLATVSPRGWWDWPAQL